MKNHENNRQERDEVVEDKILRLTATFLGSDKILLKVSFDGTLFHSGTIDPDDETAVAEFGAQVVTKAAGLFALTIEPGVVEHLLKAEAKKLAQAAEAALPAAIVEAEDRAAGQVFARDDPYRLARIYLREQHDHVDRPTLVSWGETFLAWDGRRYAVAPDITKDLTASIQAEFARLNREAVRTFRPIEEKLDPPAARKVGMRLITDTKQSLAALVRVPASLDEPAWLIPGGEETFPAREMVPFANGLVHLPSYVAGKEYGIDPTPAYFSTRCLPFDFDPEAPEPQLWLKFLDQLWEDDIESIEALQEWFGCCITPDTSFQKIFLIIGPTRSGKGTIGRVLTALLGSESVAGPSLASLAKNFGAESLIGKTLAIVPDARLSGRADQGVIVERLLSISGEDRIENDRKHRTAWTGTLPTRLLLLSNELPKLRDASQALADRLIVLPLTVSFLGKEDRTLTARLHPELPGIFNWAVAGWKRLIERGHFAMPESSLGLVGEIKAIASPIAQFVADCCVVGPGRTALVEQLYQCYRKWCEGQGKLNAPDKPSFGRDLRTVVPKLKNVQQTIDGNRERIYQGIELRESGLVGTVPHPEQRS